MKILFCLILSITTIVTNAQQQHYLKVHFLYGSRPIPKYARSEKIWFGGIHGGHVGIESETDQIVSFTPKGKFHVFANNKNRHSRYIIHDFNAFYSLFGTHQDSVKKVIIYIPISAIQKQKFDSIAHSYMQQTPYDYAFIGMRCGAAAYDILAQLNIVDNYNYKKTFTKIFYPQKLRKRLLFKAKIYDWQVEKFEGSKRRKWEKD